METDLDGIVSKRCHKNCITALAVSGDKIASGGKDSTVLVHRWDEAQMTCVAKYDLATVNESRCNVTSLDCANELVAAATSLGLVNLIDTRSSSKFRAHMKAASCVKFLAENLVATAGLDGKLRVWDLRSLRLPTQDLVGHTAGVNWLDSLPAEARDEQLVSFGDAHERILSCASDKTVRLWNINSGTHLVFRIPAEMSQNVECCCLIAKRPCYLFAVGLDDDYLLLFSSRLKDCVHRHSFGPGVAVSCLRHHRGLLVAGTSAGDVCVFRLCADEGLRCELVRRLSLAGCVNDLAVRDAAECPAPGDSRLTLFVALGTELRLGRWASFGEGAKNQIVVTQITLD